MAAKGRLSVYYLDQPAILLSYPKKQACVTDSFARAYEQTAFGSVSVSLVEIKTSDVVIKKEY